MKDIQPDPKRFEREKNNAPCRRRSERPNDSACTRKEPRAVLFPTGANTVIGCVKWRKTSRGHVGLVEAAFKNMMLLPYPVPCSTWSSY